MEPAGGRNRCKVEREEGRFFEKKRAKNFRDAGSWVVASPTPTAQRSKSLFASFSSEKEALNFFT
jgi:hypothetical protein